MMDGYTTFGGESIDFELGARKSSNFAFCMSVVWFTKLMLVILFAF